ncbi:MAG: transposase, partial [Dissulfurispiraceae bacterium]
ADEQRMPYIRKNSARVLTVDFTQLPESDREKAKRKYAYVTEIIRRGLDRITKQSVEPIVSEVSREINDATPPSWIQVYRWHRDFMISGQNIRSLVPLNKQKGNHERKLPQEVIDMIETVVREKYLNTQRWSVQSVHEAVIARVAHENSFREPCERIEKPSYWASYRIIKKLDPYEEMKARYGKAAADLKFKPVMQGIRPTRVLERVEIDHTKLDLFVIDTQRKMPIGRPWLTTAIDVYTKCIAGMYVSFNPPSYLSVMQCMRHAIAPKTYVKQRYPEIRHEWSAYGIMETVVVDNGKEFHSTHFEDACLQLGIVLQYAPIKLAWYKPSIERYFGTLNTRLLHQQPGTSFSNIVEKGDYDPRKNAIIDFNTLMAVLHKWIVDVYHHDEHRGIHDIPALRWGKAIEEFSPALPSSREELDVMLGMIEKRVVSKSGIELHGLFYNDDSLALLRRKRRGEGKVTVKYDPGDLSMIWVFDEDNNTFIPVPAQAVAYSQGLTLWQHNVIRRYARKYVNENCDMVSLSLAKEEIQRMVEDAWNSSKKSGTRQKAARWLNLSQENETLQPDGSNEPTRLPLIKPVDGLVMPASSEHPMSRISDMGNPICCDNADGTKEIAGGSRDGVGITKEHTGKKGQSFKRRAGRPRKEKPIVRDAAENTSGYRINDRSSLTPTPVNVEENSDLSGWDFSYAMPGREEI